MATQQQQESSSVVERRLRPIYGIINILIII